MPDIIHKSSAGKMADHLSFVMAHDDADLAKDTGVASAIMKTGLDKFNANPVALVHHRSGDFPIGIWTNIRKVGPALIGDLKLAASGTSRVADQAASLIQQGILRAVSVGFRSIRAETNKAGGKHFLEAELLECSLVSVPANPRALLIAKSMGMDDLEIKDFFGASDDIFTEEEAAEQQALRLKAAKARATQALINATRAARRKGEL